jgi:transcriptional regulator with XRE-family HTH domain
MAKVLKHPLEAFRDGNGQMSQADAAQLVGITQEMWSRLERGTAYASPAVAKRISDVTGSTGTC